MESVFSNSLIMDLIAEELTLSDIKNLRQVDKPMNAIMLPHFVKRDLALIVSSNNSSSEWLLYVNPILFKKVQLKLGETKSTTTIVEFFQKFHSSIENLNIVVSSKFVPVLSEIFKTCQFPTLTHLSIKKMKKSHALMPKKTFSSPEIELPLLPSLISLRFELDRDYAVKNDQKDKKFHPLIQFLINKSSPKLQELILHEKNIDLDLSGCTSLQRMRIKVMQKMDHEYPYDSDASDFEEDFYMGFNLKWITKMVDKVKLTLEELTLDLDSVEHRQVEYPTTAFRFPKCLPNLKVLNILALDLFDIREVALGPENLPKLETISLGYYNYHNRDNLEYSLKRCIPFPTVKELKFTGDGESVQLVKKAQVVFPNVTSLTVKPEGFIHHSDGLAAYFRQICTGENWKIENLTINSELFIRFEWIENIPMEGLEKLELLGRVEYNGERTLSSFKRTKLLNTKSVKKCILKITEIIEPVEKSLREFIKEEQLPVEIRLLKKGEKEDFF